MSAREADTACRDTSAARREAGFARALLDPLCDLPPGLFVPRGGDARRRFAVYRNNVTAGLVEATLEGFPSLRGHLGERYFRAMAREFVRAHPPDSPVLARYGEALPGFVETFPPLARWPWLGDVARVELARRRASDAADERPTAADTLLGTGADALETLVPRPHPSLRLVRSRAPALTLWRAGLGEARPGPHDAAAEDVAVVRPAMRVREHRLPPGGHAFLARMDGRATLGDAGRAALADAPDADVPALLALAVTSGALSAFAPATPKDGD